MNSLSPEETLRSYCFGNLGSMGWGRGSSPLPGGGNKGTLSVGNININNKLNKIVLLFMITMGQESGDSLSVIKHSSLWRQTAPADPPAQAKPLPFIYSCTGRKHGTQIGYTKSPCSSLPFTLLHRLHPSQHHMYKKKHNTTRNPHPCISPKKLPISQAQVGLELRPPVSVAVTPGFTGLSGTVLAHPLQPGRLARAWGNEH